MIIVHGFIGDMSIIDSREQEANRVDNSAIKTLFFAMLTVINYYYNIFIIVRSELVSASLDASSSLSFF